jgi:hypothetical protein
MVKVASPPHCSSAVPSLAPHARGPLQHVPASVVRECERAENMADDVILVTMFLCVCVCVCVYLVPGHVLPAPADRVLHRAAPC